MARALSFRRHSRFRLGTASAPKSLSDKRSLLGKGLISAARKQSSNPAQQTVLLRQTRNRNLHYTFALAKISLPYHKKIRKDTICNFVPKLNLSHY
jgi:hypothetical protein